MHGTRRHAQRLWVGGSVGKRPGEKSVQAIPFLARYSLDNNSNDSSGSGNNGTDTAITYQLTPVILGTHSANFNGTTSKIVVAHAASLNTGNNSIAVAVWVYPTSTATYQAVVAKTNTASTEGWEIANASGTWRVTIYGNGNSITINSGTVTLNTWQLISFSYDGNSARFFKNGSPLVASNNTVMVVDTPNELIIGARNTGSYTSFFTGNIDEVQIFKHNLSDTDMTNIYNAGAGTTAPNFTGRSINIAGTNAAPTGLGLVAKTSLQAKGFTVTTN